MGIFKRFLNIVKTNLEDTNYNKKQDIFTEEFPELQKIIDELNSEDFLDSDIYKTQQDFKEFSNNSFNLNNINNKSNIDDDIIKAYNIIGVSLDASVNEIKTMFKQKIKSVHPDNIEQNKLTPEEAKLETISILKAYNKIRLYKKF